MTAVPNYEEPAAPPADELYAGVPGVLDDDGIEAEVRAGIARFAGDDDHTPVWHIDSPELAEWAMAKLAEAQQDDANLRAQRDAQMERAQAWYARVSRRAQSTAGFMLAHLEDYALRQRELTGRATVVLPNGEVATRKGSGPAVDIEDAAAVVAWAQKNAPQIVDTTHKVLVTNLRTVARAKGDSVVDGKGRPIPGAVVRPEGDPTVTVKPY
jgi:hypothetical protein